MTQEALLDYAPSKEEEIARLKKKAADNTARIEALMSDPVIAEFQTVAKKLDKKTKEIEKLRSENSKLNEELVSFLLPVVTEPTENGYYIFAKSESRHSYQRKVRLVKINRSLFLKSMGYWFNLSDGGSNSPVSDSWHNTFEDLLDIDRDTIEASITKLEDTSVFPTDLLGEIEGDYEKAEGFDLDDDDLAEIKALQAPDDDEENE